MLRETRNVTCVRRSATKMKDTEAMKTKTMTGWRRQEGFSLLELVIALGIALILTATAFYSLGAREKFYGPDQDAAKIIDFCRTASAKALSDRRVFRVRIDLTNKEIFLLDEARSNAILRRGLLNPTYEALVSDTRPDGVEAEGLPGYDSLITENEAGGNVINIRFRSDGTVVNTGGNISSGTIFISSVTDQTGGTGAEPPPPVVRAVTLFGPSSALKLWRYDFDSSQFIAR